MHDYHKILKEYWGYDEFRPLQLDIIKSIGNGTDTLGLMPTGGGKSLTFQVPALTMEGICLVVTPLIALMKDQVENLQQKGIKAAAIYSGMGYKEMMICFDNCTFGNYKFLYLSPERLGTRLFQEKLKNLQVSMLAIDESHCISQWGYDFRPSYLKIAKIRELLPNTAVLALTATATPEVVKDIQKRLLFKNGKVFQKSFSRSNLAYVVKETNDKAQQLLRILNAIEGTSVVYVRNRKKTKAVAEFLQEAGITANYFHAGLPNTQKDERQTKWKSGEYRVMVATNAFGMGIDKAEVRTVIHLDLPDSIEAYFQEAGRAGRDEQKAYAVLLYDKQDSINLKKRIRDNFPSKENIRLCYEKLAYYIQIGVEQGEGQSFNFDIYHFCQTYKLAITPTYNALKLLELAGYLSYTENAESYSRLMIIAKKEQIYHTNLSPKSDTIIQTILRMYTGTFADFRRIDEAKLAKKAQISNIECKKALINLSKQGIIKYISSRQQPYITYTQDRLEENRILLPKEIYEDRKERYSKRIKALLNYATDHKHCRSRTLLAYFGETDTKACGQCDICFEKRKHEALPSIHAAIKKTLTPTPLSVKELVSTLHYSETRALEAIRQLIDSNVIKINPDKKLTLK